MEWLSVQTKEAQTGFYQLHCNDMNYYLSIGQMNTVNNYQSNTHNANI